MGCLARIVVILVALFVGINWGTHTGHTPGGKTVLSIIAVVAIAVVGFIIIWLIEKAIDAAHESEYERSRRPWKAK